MRPDVWEEFQPRFNIPRVLEFYGSTEGNVSVFNFDGKMGAIGRVPGFLKKQINIRLVEFDLDTELPVRGSDGLCRLARPGEIGEAIGAKAETALKRFVLRSAMVSAPWPPMEWPVMPWRPISAGRLASMSSGSSRSR